MHNIISKYFMQKFTPPLLVFVVILVALGPITLAYAEQAPTGPSGSSELEAFFDDYLAAQMTADNVAGVTVSVVKDGQVLMSKGYGYADVTRNIPVDPKKTVFILGSLSKLFTWTAVMQLVEQGQLDLDADVNTYLDFKIPATYPEPITLNHIMAHTAGFEDNKFGQMAATPEQMTPLGEWLKAHIPARVRAPGRFSAYANYGTALAGYIIERVSGMSYDDYIEKNILTPLGMAYTTARQPIPDALNANMSKGYIFANGEYQPRPEFNVAANVAPAAAFRSTASDIARFMIAHLNDGRYGEASILQSATDQLMHRQSFSHDPHVNGMAHGFWELDMNGQEIIGHAGSHFTFNSFLMLFPAHKLGVFIASNSQGGMAFLGENYSAFQHAFVDYYFPQDLPALTPPADFAQRAGRLSGSYHMLMGRSETTPEKLFSMIMAANIQADGNSLSVALLGDNKRFVEVEPLVFRQVDDEAVIVFHEGDDGNITQSFLKSAPVTALVKSRWFETIAFNLTVLGVCVVLFLSVLIAAPVAFFIQRKRANYIPSTRLERTARWVAGLMSLLSLLLLFGVFASLFNIYDLYVGNLPVWTFIPSLSIVVALLALGTIVFTILAWIQRFWGLAERIHCTLAALAAVGFVWFMCFWNLLGKSF
jgi:CubicO group peptidase (beta-lactamase class C family)